MRKKKLGLRVSLPKLYSGERYLRLLPLSLMIPPCKADEVWEFESQVNILGFFLWNFWLCRYPNGEANFNITILGFSFSAFYE